MSKTVSKWALSLLVAAVSCSLLYAQDESRFLAGC